MDLEEFGWDSAWALAFAPHREAGRLPARVVASGRGIHRLLGAGGELLGEAAGRLRGETIATGDWTAVAAREDRRATIQAVLPRRSAVSRRAAGPRAEEQVLAANVDVVLLVAGLDGDFNPRRLERALTMVWESGALPVILLNKADLCPDPEARAAEVAGSSPGVDVHLVSAREGQGLEAIGRHLTRGRTAVLLGSSGVGKSTLVNRLLSEERQATREVRAHDSRGRHATTGRELFVLPDGGCLIDTPGLRELQLWTEGHGLEAAFADVAALAEGCRFRDCRHHHEPGCAVRAAVEAGALASGRLASLHKLEREQEALLARQDRQLAGRRKARNKQTQQALKQLYRDRGKH